MHPTVLAFRVTAFWLSRGTLIVRAFANEKRDAHAMIIGRKISVQAATALLAAFAAVVLLAAMPSPAAAAAGGSYAWAIKGGASGFTIAYGVSALPDGSSIITGLFDGTATFGATTLISTGASDVFTAKVNADGSYAWATKAGGPNYDRAFGVSALPDGSSIITGDFSGTATFGTTTLISAGNNDIFTAKVNADGSYAWAIRAGGPALDRAHGVSVLPDGSSIITGYVLSGTVIYTAKLNADGTYAWATQSGGAISASGAYGVSALADGSSIITGAFAGTVTFGTTTLTSAGFSSDTFTAKVNADGSYAWASQGGGTGGGRANGVSALADGSSIITGEFTGTETFGATTLISAGALDTFTAKVNADGTYAWATRAGGTGSYDRAFGVSVLPDGSSIITGTFQDAVTFGATTLISTGASGTFTAKLNADGSYAWAIKADGVSSSQGIANGVSVLPDGSSIITGTFSSTVTFGATTLISGTGQDAFTARIVANPHPAPDLPPAPTGVSASAGIRQATITWNAVAGGSVSSYTVTASPGGASCTAVAPATSCTITGLTAGTSYTFTVTATDPQGTSLASQASNAVTPTGDVPVNTFTMKPSKIWPQKITTQLKLPGPGKVVQVAKKARTMTVCTARKTVAKAGWVTITCRLSAKARAARLKQSLKLRLVTTFTPTGGSAKSVSKTLVLKKTRPSPYTG